MKNDDDGDNDDPRNIIILGVLQIDPQKLLFNTYFCENKTNKQKISSTKEFQEILNAYIFGELSPF